MCAIIDANVSHEVFGSSRPEAGKEFFVWLHDGSGFLVVGGRLLDELYSTQAREWARQAALSGQMKIVNSTDVAVKERELLDQHVLRSDDPHVIALALVSGARLLYSNDPGPSAGFRGQTACRRSKGQSLYDANTQKFLGIPIGDCWQDAIFADASGSFWWPFSNCVESRAWLGVVTGLGCPWDLVTEYGVEDEEQFAHGGATTMVRGQVVYTDGQIVMEPGHGRCLRPET